MTIYTAEDFASVEFARHPDGRTAMRFEADSRPWLANTDRWRSDVEMAEHGWVPVREAADQPITLDALRDAWETAEQADERNEGDVLIRRDPTASDGVVEVWRSEMAAPIGPYTRILRRAPKPKREPWQDLADVLRAHTGEPDPDETARMLHERGVRMTEEMSEEYA